MASSFDVYFDNAGGSQVLDSVIESINTYLLATNVQLGATYSVSTKSTSKYSDGLAACAKYINAAPSEIVVGPSTTQLMRNLSIALTFPPESEIIVSKLDHEANIAPWIQIAEWKNLTLKWWSPSVSSTNPILDPADLKTLLTPHTRLVACTHTSNLLGTISDIASISKTVHSVPGALLCVDAVAYAPHRAVDVKALGVDFYAFSWYKVYGPHISMLYASESAQHQLQSLGHYFKHADNLEVKLGLAGANYECVQSIPHVLQYLDRQTWQAITAHEEKLQEILLAYLRSRADVTIYGEPSSSAKLRVPLISFVVDGRSPQSVVDHIEQRSQFGLRSGHMYSLRLANDVLGLEGDEGVIRVSMVHYNTEDEVRGLVKVLDEVLSDDPAGRVK